MSDRTEQNREDFSSELRSELRVPEGDGEGYLTEEWLEDFEAWEPTPAQAVRFLLDTLPEAVALLSCVHLASRRIESDIYGPSLLIEYSTGGWSGAEALVGIMTRKFWIRHFHARWERGGHYEFEVPDKTAKAFLAHGIAQDPAPDPTSGINPNTPADVTERESK